MFGVRGLALVALAVWATVAPALADPPAQVPLAVEAAAPMPAQVTLATALAELHAQARSLATPPPGATWGQHQALDDLKRLEGVTQELQAALTDDPQVTPTQLHPLREQLGVARLRLQASLPLLGVPSESLFGEIDRVALCLRKLEYRFDGRAQLQGAALAEASVVEPPELPVYENPQELLLEARNVRYLAEAFTRLRSAWRGASSPGWGWGTEFYDFLGAAYDFESVCNSGYVNVRQTRPAYKKLVRTYNKARTFGYGLDQFRWTQLENAFSRLERFYAVAP